MPPTLETAIEALGQELVACSDHCAGIWLEAAKGVLPRTLVLERGTATGRGSVAVGLNPGTSKPPERSFYLSSVPSYGRIIEYFQSTVAGKPYFARARRVIDQMGLAGPILWSNLAKCENETGRKGLPPLQTLRHCTQRFLRRELAAVPPDWVIVGIGWEAYRALAYLVPERPVIGMPHPTGGYRDFRKMLDGDHLREELLNRARQVLRSGEPSTTWLGSSSLQGRTLEP